MSRGPGGGIAAAWAPFYLQRLKALYPQSQVTLFETLPEYALAFCPHMTDPREIAQDRVKKIYSRLQHIPTQAKHAVGWWIDTHAPLILSDATKMCEAYRRGLAPEQNYTFPPAAATRISKHLWLSSVHSNLNPSEVACLKLLRKASVSPPSIRYISTQLTRCANLPGEAQRVARSLILMHLLGLYPGRTVIAAPSVRFALYKKTTPELAVHLSSCTSRDMYGIVATYLVWATRAELALWQFCYRMYPRYMNEIMNSGLESDTKVFVECGGMSPAWRRPSTYNIFFDALDVKKKLPAWVQIAVNQLSDMERCIRVGSLLTGGVSTAMLEAAGITRESAAKLACSVVTKARASAILQSISERERAILYIVLMSRETRGRIRIGRLNAHQALAQEAAVARVHGSTAKLYTCVCVACGTWRPKSRGLSGLSKATGGIVVNYTEKKIICCACSADWSVVMVPLVGHLVMARLRLTAEPVVIGLCGGCAQVTHPLYPVGSQIYCKSCKNGPAKFVGIRPACAVCDESVVPDEQNVITVVAANGLHTTVVLCSRHQYVSKNVSASTNIASLKALATRSKHSAFYKPRGGVRLNHGRKL